MTTTKPRWTDAQRREGHHAISLGQGQSNLLTRWVGWAGGWVGEWVGGTVTGRLGLRCRAVPCAAAVQLVAAASARLAATLRRSLTPLLELPCPAPCPLPPPVCRWSVAGVKYHHDLTILNGALLCVASLGSALDMNLDHHRAGGCPLCLLCTLCALCLLCLPCTMCPPCPL